VMGPAKARRKDVENARVLGELIARREWVLLTGGRDVGVMHAASQGAKKSGQELDGRCFAHDTGQDFQVRGRGDRHGNGQREKQHLRVFKSGQCGLRFGRIRDRFRGGTGTEGGKGSGAAWGDAGRGNIFQKSRGPAGFERTDSGGRH
jgi:hypothetical protein